MGRANERVGVAEKALLAFQEVMRIEKPTAIERDAAIQRFQFTFEAIWKAAKEVLYEREGLDIGSPKGVIRSSREVGMLAEAQAVTALEMADDRNLSVYTYNEQLAVAIYGRLGRYLELMQGWLENLK